MILYMTVVIKKGPKKTKGRINRCPNFTFLDLRRCGPALSRHDIEGRLRNTCLFEGRIHSSAGLRPSDIHLRSPCTSSGVMAPYTQCIKLNVRIVPPVSSTSSVPAWLHMRHYLPWRSRTENFASSHWPCSLSSARGRLCSCRIWWDGQPLIAWTGPISQSRSISSRFSVSTPKRGGIHGLPALGFQSQTPDAQGPW